MHCAPASNVLVDKENVNGMEMNMNLKWVLELHKISLVDKISSLSWTN